MEKLESNYKEILEIIANIAECSIDDIKADTNLPEELGINSLMGLEILVMIERKFKVKISEEELVKMTTPQVIVDMISEHLEKTAQIINDEK